MQELGWIAEVVGAWLAGASWAEINAMPGFKMLFALACWVVGPSLVALGLGTSFHETIWGKWVGAEAPNNDWAYRAGDIDKDGLTDF